MADDAGLPRFRYHPDPLQTGSVVRREVHCASCDQGRAFTYVGPVYAVEELAGRLCPWCIADGRAAAAFDASFTDVEWRIPEDVPADVTDVISRRTPGFPGWQQARWLHHCGDAAEFHGAVGAGELAPFPDAVSQLRSALVIHRWAATDIDEYLQALDKDASPTAYLFRCLHCGWHLAYSDFL